MKNIILLLLFLISVLSENVIELTDQTFDKVVDGSKHVFVKFYAPWCGHCKNLAPTFEQLGDKFSKEEDIVIAKIDADEFKSVGSKYQVKGYPTLKLFSKGSKDPVTFSGARDLNSLVSFVNKNTGRSTEVPPKPSKESPSQTSAALSLTEENFDQTIKNGKKAVFVEFFAPWCGHCKKLEPTYEKVASKFKDDPNCIVAKVDTSVHNDLARNNGIQGIPTLKLFRGSGDVVQYKGARTEEAIVEFLKKECSMARQAPTETETELKSGFMSKLDQLASQFISDSNKQKVIDQAKKLSSKAADKLSGYYVKVMESLSINPDYVKSEFSRLTNLLKSGKLSGDKEEDAEAKRNILNSFKDKKEKENRDEL